MDGFDGMVQYGILFPFQGLNFDFVGAPCGRAVSAQDDRVMASYCEVFGAGERRWAIALVKQKHKVLQG